MQSWKGSRVTGRLPTYSGHSTGLRFQVASMASAVASSVAQLLAQHTDEDVLQALQLFDSLRPHLRAAIEQFDEPFKRYEGQLGHVNPQKGFGFITSPEATQDFGKDVFVSTNETGQFQQGESVTFTVVANKNGQPQARLVQGANGSVPLFMDLLVPGQQPQVSTAPTIARAEQQSAKRARVAPPPPPVLPVGGPATSLHQMPKTSKPSFPPQQQQQPQHPPQNRYVGTITSFNEKFGFISCPRATEEFGKDVFLSSMELGGHRPGDTVSFEIALNKNGQPQARNLDRSVQAAAPKPSSSVPRPPAPVARQAEQLQGEDMTRYVGTIESFTAEKRFGFIKCPEIFAQFAKDVFLSDQEIAGYQIGDMVSFRVVLNNRGNPQARDLGTPGLESVDVHGGLA